MAVDPARLPQPQHDPPLLRSLPPRRHLAEDPRCAAGPGACGGGQGAHAIGGHHRQPKRQDDGKRGIRGFDAAKRIKGRKRSLIVDTMGMIWSLVVHSAGLQDNDLSAAGAAMLQLSRAWVPRMQLIWCDSAYRGMVEPWAQQLGP